MAILAISSSIVAGCGSTSSPTAGNPIKQANAVNLGVSVQFPTAPTTDATKLVIPSNTATIEVDAFTTSSSDVEYELESPLILTPSSPRGTLPAVPVGAELEIIARARDSEDEVIAIGVEFVSVGPTTSRVALELDAGDSANQLVDIGGQVVNANTGQALVNAVVEIPGFLSDTTDSDGQYTLTGEVPLSALVGGVFLLEVTPDSDSGCIRQTQDVTSSSAPQEINVNLNCSETDDPIITLGWGQNPSDLDAHLLGPTGERLFFADRSASFGTLDLDDVSSEGPETATLTLSTGVNDGTYAYCVHWFGGEPTDRSTDLPARVTFAGPGFNDQTFTRFFDSEGITGGSTLGTWAVATFDVVNGSIANFTALDREATPAVSTTVCNEILNSE